MEIFFTGIALIVTGGLLAEFTGSRYKHIVFPLFSAGGSIMTCMVSLTALAGYSAPSATLYFNYPVGKTVFILDPLSSLFLFIFSVVFIPVSVYTAGYMKHYNDRIKERLHYISISLLASSMMLVITVTNGIIFIILWEIMSLSSFVLVSFENEKEEVYRASINYFVAMHVCAVFIIALFAYLSYSSGGNSFEDFQVFLTAGKVRTEIIYLLLFAGFGAKAGFFPFHSWLPKAHPAAPSHVSSMMSGLMIKCGIYGILRFLILAGGGSLFAGLFLLAVSLFTSLYGILYAMNDRDLKRQLAWSSIENIGIMGIAISIGILGSATGNSYMSLLGYTGAVLHILNHALFKTLLFFSAGNVYLNSHHRNIELMGGILKKLPFTGSFYIFASIAIAGLPPLNGFIGEFFIYYSMLIGAKTSPLLFIVMISSFALLALVGGVAIVAFTKSSGIVFLGQPRSGSIDHYHEEKATIIPMLFMAVLIFLAGVFPHRVITLVSTAVSQISGSLTAADMSPLFSIALSLSRGVAIFYGILLFITAARIIIYRRQSVEHYKTWDCGYQGGTPRMQYSASSFSSDTVTVTRPFLLRKKTVREPSGLFPGKSFLETVNIDLIDILINRFIKRGIDSLFNAVSVIQSRSAQQYVIYVILFIIVTFVWVIAVR